MPVTVISPDIKTNYQKGPNRSTFRNYCIPFASEILIIIVSLYIHWSTLTKSRDPFSHADLSGMLYSLEGDTLCSVIFLKRGAGAGAGCSIIMQVFFSIAWARWKVHAPVINKKILTCYLKHSWRIHQNDLQTLWSIRHTNMLPSWNIHYIDM